MRTLVLAATVAGCTAPRTGDPGTLTPDGGGPPVGCVAQVATSIGQDGGHTCALTSDGAVWCWGRDHRGQVGDGQFITSGPPYGVPSPTRVADLEGASAVSLGERHSCALLADGSLWCWGWDQDDQLGGATLPPASARPVQVVQWSSDFTSTTPLGGGLQISAGGWSSAMLDATGSAWAWGENFGAWTDANCTTTACQAFHLPFLAGSIRALATGAFYGCAVTTDDRAWCWGDNSYGRLGSSVATPATATQIAALANVDSIAAGFGHTCAVAHDGTAWCWGWNTYGQLGDAATTSSSTPVQVALTDVAQISAGGAHTCAVKRDGTAWCWGFDASGQLGTGTVAQTPEPLPAQVASSGTHFTAIQAGDLATCAIDDLHQLWCWGDNTFGQLGTGSFAPSSVPALVALACPGVP
jgi:alpha-tubulin suppressor-like RCC1 family protein